MSLLLTRWQQTDIYDSGIIAVLTQVKYSREEAEGRRQRAEGRGQEAEVRIKAAFLLP